MFNTACAPCTKAKLMSDAGIFLGSSLLHSKLYLKNLRITIIVLVSEDRVGVLERCCTFYTSNLFKCKAEDFLLITFLNIQFTYCSGMWRVRRTDGSEGVRT